MLRCVFVAAVALATALPATAQSVQRNFPQNALRGEITFGTPPEILLNGQNARLAPGARIRGLNNMLVLTGALAGSKAVVNYTVEINGLVLDVWILTAAEMAKKPWPATPQEAQSWRFDPLAQVWSKP
jgi:hypothetical protein